MARTFRTGKIMLLTRENPAQINQIQSYDDAAFVVNGQRFTSSLIVRAEDPVEIWSLAEFAALRVEDVAHLAALKPALVLLGTGKRQRFPPVRLLEPLITAGIGFEIMDTGSACRTFNLLASEGRDVLAALVLEGEC
jgi:uncharacterized protein